MLRGSLDNVTKDYTELPLDKINKVIESEEKRSGESLDAFGIKFPADVTLRLGIVLILGVQIYLWLHLHELSDQMAPNDPGWEVAWIGVYRSWSSRVALFLTLCVMPTGAAMALGIRGLYLGRFEGRYWIICVVGSLLCLFVGTLTFLRSPTLRDLTVPYRAQVVPPPAEKE